MFAKNFRASNKLVIFHGVKTNIDFQYSILETEEFLRGEYDTSFLGEKMVIKNV